MTPRLNNWPSLLDDFIESRRHTPFEWGANDCCLFAADAVLAITGTDIARAFRGTYSNAFGASRHLKTWGGIAGLVESKALPEQPLSLAQRGDLVMAHMPGGESLGVCVGGSVAFVTPTGLTFWPITECSRSWRAGRI